MELKRYCQLTPKEQQSLLIMVTETQVSGSPPFQDIEGMRRCYAGGIHEHGRLHFSCWENERVIAALSVIAREAAWNGEIYITNVAVPQANTAWFSPFLREVLRLTRSLPHHTIKLCIPLGQMYLEPPAVALGFIPYSRSVTMTTPTPFALPLQSRLQFQAAEPGEYVAIHNAAFLLSPNGARTDEAEFDERIAMGAHLLTGYTGERAVAILDLHTADHVGYLNVLGVSPAEQGRGYGRDALLYALHKLSALGAKACKLVVFLNNAKAVALYQSAGFKEESTWGYWLIRDKDV